MSYAGRRPHSRCLTKLVTVVLSLIAALAITGLSLTANAYVLEGQRWPDGSVVVLQLSLGNAGRILQDGNTSWNDAIAPVAPMWGQEIQRIQFTQILDSTVPCSTGDHLNSVAFASSVFGQSFGPNTLAVTYYRYSGSTMAESDTLFNQAMNWDSYRGPVQYPSQGFPLADIRRVFLHELGHTVGLDHPDDAGQNVVAIMNSTMSNQQVLAGDDIAGAQAIYGVAPVPTPIPTPGPGSPSHLANISTRVNVGLAENVVVGGFIVRGSQSKTVIVRAIGPSLAGSIGNVLADPVLELHNSTGLIASNDNWSTGSQASEISASGLAPSNPHESAILMTLSPNSYTAIVKGFQNGSGVGLVEVYEMDGNTARLVNMSSRGQVGISNNAMIGGLIVRGTNVKRAIVRAIGPSLGTGPNAIANPLGDPVLEIYDDSGNLLVSNDDWTSSYQYDEIVASGLQPPNAKESAIIVGCGPGNYTAIVRGANNTTGIGLVEVYDLDP